jgi:hypothetical protein
MQSNVQQFPPFREADGAHAHDDHGHDAHEHHEPNFWQKYIFSTDHKVIGIQYGFMALCFMLFGFFLMLLMRWQIAHPGVPVPVFGPLLEKILGQPAAHGAISPTFTIPSARCTAPSWCFSASCRWRSRRSATTSCR